MRGITGGRDPERVPDATKGECEHLREAFDVPLPPAGQLCEACERNGTTGFHLRMCLSCAHLGCCDSSHHHATEHFEHTGHPVMRSVEPGESWRWCYVHEQLG